MNRTFIPADATLAELQKKAADCEQRAMHEQEPLATALREEAKLYREWTATLRSGRWMS
jgi:hypothetical protein